MHDVVIIGGGHNGLVAAAFLAKAGLKHARPRAGRAGWGLRDHLRDRPGFRCPTLAHRAAIDPAILRALDLARHGLEIVRPAARVWAPSEDGRSLTIWADATRAARAIAAFSPADAERYPGFLASVAAISRVLRTLIETLPPSVDHLSAAGVIDLLKTARKFRALGKADAYRLLRWLPMPAADFAREWFESEPLAAVIAAGGTLGSFLGPRSGGSAAVLLWLAAGEGHPIAPGWTARGGIGRVSDALASAARQAGAEIRLGAAVRQIVVEGQAATGVVLGTGEIVPARLVVSNADPRRTLLDLVDPMHLPPEFVQAVRHIRMRGTLAKINFAVSSLPQFTGAGGSDRQEREAALSGWVRLCPGIGRARARLRCRQVRRLLATIPGSSWRSRRFSIPASRPPVSTSSRRTCSLRRTACAGRPGTANASISPMSPPPRSRGTHPASSSRWWRGRSSPRWIWRRTYGLTGGQIFHGEIALDQLLSGRPLLGWARYATPIRNLFLCGAGTHPGTGLDGRAGMLAAKQIIKARGRSHG